MQGVGEDEIEQRIEASLGKLEVVNGGQLDGEARLYRLPGARGTIGVIATVTQPFCASCTRARLTADGRLRLCLLREVEADLLAPLRLGASDDELRQIIIDAIWEKPWGHRLADGEVPLNRAMSEIGG
jgi:cyclic pyranopterin phosphate synthase